MYAIVFGTERFHQYSYGRRVEVTTDHKPLEAILRNPLSAAPARLQRVIPLLQKYARHKPGKEIPVADTFSRLHLRETDYRYGAFDAQVHLVLASLPVSDQKMSDPQAITTCDPDMQRLIAVIREGWPNDRSTCPSSVKPLWNYREKLSVVEGLVFKGGTIVIPSALRKESTQDRHMGMVKSQNRAKEVVFWPRTSSRCLKLFSLH